MKILTRPDRTLIDLFEREINLLSMIHHPGLPKIEDGELFKIELAQPIYGFVREYVQGTPLDQLRNDSTKTASPRQTRLNQATAIRWMIQLVEVLDLLHQNGVFHRDISLANIVLKPDGQLVLIDFGGARSFTTSTYLARIGRGLDASEIGVNPTIVMTSGYTPPEQIDGQAVPQSDFYALGRVFIYLLTGHLPGQLKRDLQRGRLVWRSEAPQVTKPFADLIDQLVDPIPGRRPPNTAMLLQLLQYQLPRQIKRDRLMHSRWGRIGIGVALAISVVAAYRSAAWLGGQYYLAQGVSNQQNNRFDAAKANYEAALRFDPQNPEVHNNLGVLCYQQRLLQAGTPSPQWEGCALTHLERSIALSPQYWQAHYNLAAVYEALERYADAENQYNRVIAADASLAFESRSNLARLKLIEAQYATAEAIARQGLQNPDSSSNSPTKAALLKNLGWSLVEQQRWNEAKTELQASIRESSIPPDAYCLLAQVHDALRELPDAQTAWGNCLLRNSTLPEVQQWKKAALKKLVR